MDREWRTRLKKGSKCLIGVEFQILGPLAASHEGRPLRLGGRKQRALLAVLLLRANELVPADRLVEEIWHDANPEAAARSLQVYVSSLRKALGRSAAALQTRGGGYVIEVAPEQLDAARFERLFDEGRAALSDGDPDRAAALLHEALALWRGPALADLSYESFAQAEIGRLEELRLEALETRIEADLALAQHGQVVAELEALVDEHPLRERLRRHLMLALYRTGRQPDALQTFRDARDALVEELGLEPSAELHDLQGAILRQDPALAVEPPELRARRHLPTPATPLVGRGAELEYMHRLFQEEHARLATLTGPGGTGKTRLAVQAAWELAEHFPDGVYFVGLASVRESQQVPTAIARALDVREARGRPLPETLKKYVLHRKLLLVLDNFEHVQEAAPFVGELLAEGSGVKALVTSRSRLHLYGEHEYRVPPLTEEEALDLFSARARAVRPGFALDSARTDVAEVCRRLDRLPLAIELAAARSSHLSPERMLGFLTRHLELATHGPLDAPARQQTLRATIEWSHGLLEAAERSLFARLSVFLGGCTLEAAEEVCGAELETLAAVVDKSLVRETVALDGDPRFAMLETIREYALERLDESGEGKELRRRHAVHFLALAEEAEPRVRRDSREWIERLEREHDNLRAALDHLESAGESQLALRLVGALSRFWYLKGHLAEGRRRLESALAADERPSEARATALNGAAVIAVNIGDTTTARLWAEEAFVLHRALGDAWGAAYAGFMVGIAAGGDGDLAGAQPLLEESARAFRELGDEHYTLLASINLAWMYYELGDSESARALDEQNLRQARATSDKSMEAESLGALAGYAVDEGRVEDAVSMLKESLRIYQDLGEVVEIANNLSRMARALAVVGRARTAARILSSSEALLEEIDAVVPWIVERNELTLITIRTQLHDAAFAEACEQGRALTLDAALALALDSKVVGK